MDQAPDIDARPGGAPYHDPYSAPYRDDPYRHDPYRDTHGTAGPPGPRDRDRPERDRDRPERGRPRRAWLAGGHRRGGTDWAQLAIYGGLVIALAALAWLAGPSDGEFIWPLVVAAIGAVIVWRQADPELWRRWAKSSLVARVQPAWVRGGFGVLLVIIGIWGFLASRGQLRQARPGLAAAGAIIVGMGIITAPWLLRLVRELDTERGERIRATEREELAAKVHDSVLHTLTLIQRSSHDPRYVQRLARSQERELRAWLYQPREDASETLSTRLDQIAGEVEDVHGVPIDVVCVGDLQLGERTSAALLAAREAMVNAAKYSGAPNISVYAEAEPDRLTIFVRDRGRGFDLDSIPPHRLGVRQSIIGRMDRAGGSALVRSAPMEGTEVEIQVMRNA